MLPTRRVLAYGLVAMVAFLVFLPSAVSGASPAPLYLPEVRSAVIPTPSPTPEPLPEIRGVWVSRFDWSPRSTYPRAEVIQQVVDDVVRGGFNTIFFQVRTAGDAYYTPGLEPWAANLTGTSPQDLGRDPGWDPLAEMVRRAHAAGLQVHAWMNVAPAWQWPADPTNPVPPDNLTPPALLYRLSWAPSVVPGGYGLGNDWRVMDSKGNGFGYIPNAYLNASLAAPQVQEHIAAVATDIASRYAVDGIHLDYVRYPGRDYSYDGLTVQACSADPACPGVSDEAWRGAYQREGVARLVARVAAQVRAARPGIWVSAAGWPQYRNVVCRERPPGPSGEDRPPLCVTTTRGYDDMYQDYYAWLADGSVDFVTPMLYTWSTQSELGSGYAEARALWSAGVSDQVASAQGRLMLPGIGAYDAGEASSLPFEEIAARIQIARDMGARGHVIFRLAYLRGNGYLDALRAGPYAQPANWP